MLRSLATDPAQPAGQITAVPAAWPALAGLSLAMLLSSLGTSIANVGLPALAAAFGATFQAVQWVVLAYLVTVTAVIVGAGRLGDILGRRWLLLAGILLFTAASVLCGAARSLPVLVFARALQGLGAAAMMALTLAFVGGIVPKAATGRAMGLLGTMSAIGTALGPSLGGALIASVGWRGLFFLNVPLGALAFFLAWRGLPPDGRRAPEVPVQWDGPGTLLLALSLAAYALAMTLGRGHFGWQNAALLAVAAGLAGWFAFVESRTTAPLVRWEWLRDPGLRAGLLTSGLVSTVLMTTLVVGPFYLSRGLGLTPAMVGLVLSVGPVVAALMGVPAGRMTDRFGAARAGRLGLLGIATGSLGLALLPATLGVAGYVAPIVVITAGYALFQTANNTGVMRDLPPDQRGVVSGLLNLSRNLGLVTGASVMGAVFAFAAGATDLAVAGPGPVATGMRVTFAVSACLVTGALVVAQRAGGGSERARR